MAKSQRRNSVPIGRMHSYRLIDDWEIWQYAERKSELTVSERVRVLVKFGDEMELQPADAQPIDIVRWLASHREWSASTTATYHSYLAAWFRWLQLMEHRVDNPMIKVGKSRYPDREPHPVSDNGLMRLLVTRMHFRTRVMVLLACLAGMRVFEIAKVRGEDIDLSVPSIRVEGKRGKVRTIPLHHLLVEAAQAMPVRGIWFPANSLRPGEHVRSKSVSDIIGDVMRRASVTGKPHSLRHWFGTTLLDDGANLRVVQELMRHSSVATTQLYTKVPDRAGKDAISRLDPFRASRPEPSLHVVEGDAA